MFRQAIAKLTASYLGVIVVISLIFSFALYGASVHEIGNSLRPPDRVLVNSPFFDNEDVYDKFRQSRITESENHILTNLIYFNLTILLVGGLASYLLAKKTLDPLEEAHNIQSRFTSDASHELRTPLSVMRSEIEVTLRGKEEITNSEARALLKSNLEEINKLTLLSDSLLKLARRQKIDQVNKGEVSLEEIAKDSIDSLSSRLKEKNIKVEGKWKELRVLGDRSMLTEVLTIIIDNAIKYSPNDSVINIETTDQDGARVKVTDHGQGISPQDLLHVFDRFYRADVSRSKVEGYGLGLSIAKQIAEFHHGKVEVTSKEGVGTVVSLVLPGSRKGKI